MRIEASARLRELAADHDIDTNFDQALSHNEIAGAINGLLSKAQREERRAEMSIRELEMITMFNRPMGGMRRGRIGGRMGGRGRFNSGINRHDYHRMQSIRSDVQFALMRADNYRSQASELYTHANSSEKISLMSIDFETRFDGLTGPQRAALIKADVKGNNDGTLTRSEYEDFNKRPFLGIAGKKRFEGHFGMSAHNRVLNALAAPAETSGPTVTRLRSIGG